MLDLSNTLQVIKSPDGNNAAARDDYHLDSLYTECRSANCKISAQLQQVGAMGARQARQSRTLVEKADS
jgi:hypothetical protein